MTIFERTLVSGVVWVCGCVAVHDDSDRGDWRQAAIETDMEPLDGGGESGDSGTDSFGDASPPGVDAYPESGECGYRREVQGEHNGKPVYGYPILEQNNCGSDQVCGRPALDGCTDQNAEHFTCGCIPLATSCSPATLAAGLASPDFHVRADSEARANDCCVANDFPKWIDDLATAVDALQPASPEAATRWESVYARCEPVCVAKYWTVTDPYEGPSFLDPFGCKVTRPCRAPYVTVTDPNRVTETCSCACELPKAPPK